MEALFISLGNRNVKFNALSIAYVDDEHKKDVKFHFYDLLYAHNFEKKLNTNFLHFLCLRTKIMGRKESNGSS